MKSINKPLSALLLIFSLTSTIVLSQFHSATILDSTSQKPIPFATISLNETSGVVSSEEGSFTMYFEKETSPGDTLFISSLGYKQKKISVEKLTDSIIYLQAENIILQEVVLLNRNYTADEIMEMVLDSLQQNYQPAYVKQRVFFRDSDINKLNKIAVDVKKSSIEELNQEFADQIIDQMPKAFPYHTELLGDLYLNMGHFQPEGLKLDPIKACELYDKNNEFSTKAMEEKMQALIRKHVKRDSYFKIKSGIIGAKTEEIDSTFFNQQVDSLKKAEEALEEQKKSKEHFTNSRRSGIHSFLKDNFLSPEADLDVIHKQNKYDFTLEGFSYLENELVYAISFEPRRGDYSGKLFVNTEDFAVMRIDYRNLEPLKKFNLFGVSYRYILREGTFLYSKAEAGGYNLKFQEENNQYVFGVDRPLKIIEKNKHVKGRRKQNQVNLNLDLAIKNMQKKTLVIFETSAIDKEIFGQMEHENTIVPAYLSQYDPSFWEGYNILSPNEAIVKFKSLEE